MEGEADLGGGSLGFVLSLMSDPPRCVFRRAGGADRLGGGCGLLDSRLCDAVVCFSPRLFVPGQQSQACFMNKRAN